MDAGRVLGILILKKARKLSRKGIALGLLLTVFFFIAVNRPVLDLFIGDPTVDSLKNLSAFFFVIWGLLIVMFFALVKYHKKS